MLRCNLQEKCLMYMSTLELPTPHIHVGHWKTITTFHAESTHGNSIKANSQIFNMEMPYLPRNCDFVKSLVT